MSEKKRVLVTGATGFIGSHLVRRLVDEGYEVAIIKRCSSSVWRIVEKLAESESTLDVLTIRNSDMRDHVKLTQIFSDFKPNIVFHLAALYAVEHNFSDISPMVGVNVQGTINLLEASRQNAVDLFVNTSTFFAYGGNDYVRREEDVPYPYNLYAVTKVQAEQACSYYAEKHDLRSVTLRLFAPYGDMMGERKMIPTAIKNLLEGKELKLTSGEQKWDYIYVEDIVDAYLKLVEPQELNLPDKHNIFNIGTGSPHNVRGVVSTLKEITGSGVKPQWGAVAQRNNEVFRYCADISKAWNYLKWRPKTSLRDGLTKTVEWYKNRLEAKREEK